MTDTAPHAELRFQAQDLVDRTPVRLSHDNKRALWALSCPPGAVHAGELWVTRWTKQTRPPWPAQGTTLTVRPDAYGYEPAPADETHWWVNFADAMLFGFYGGGLFAQDEHQVAEHPALANLREALLGTRVPPRTLEGRSTPTPVLVMGVERRCRVLTSPNAAEGRPLGLYGNHFAHAPRDVVQRATRLLDPPTRSNILAMAAPNQGRGRYSADDVRGIYDTAFTGFCAARWCSQRAWLDALKTGRTRVIVHTGFWGCGAFGGNRVLTPALQMLAAGAAGVDEVVFHAFDQAGLSDASAARSLAHAIAAQHPTTEAQLQELTARGYLWGTSDGN